MEWNANMCILMIVGRWWDVNRSTEGFSGAEVVAVCREAALVSWGHTSLGHGYKDPRHS